MMGDRAATLAPIAVVALSAWLGAALLAATVVAPAAFAVLPTRTLAGALVGHILPVLFYSGAAVGMFAVLLGRVATPSLARVIAGAAMIATCLAAQLVVAPRIERVRTEAGRPIDQLAVGDPVRTAFGRLHGASVLLLGIAGIAAAAALVLTLRETPLASTTRDSAHQPREH
jgi:small-conductance mechanosensitive channel